MNLVLPHLCWDAVSAVYSHFHRPLHSAAFSEPPWEEVGHGGLHIPNSSGGLNMEAWAAPPTLSVWNMEGPI